MSKPNVIPFLPRDEIEVPGHPSLEDAFNASQELIYLQGAYSSVQTVEQRDNNIRKSELALEIMTRYIVAAYVKELPPGSTH